MKKNFYKFIKTVVFFVILFCLIGCTAKILERKSSKERMGAFFEESEKIDVLLLGTSHMRNAVFPMELWNDYGITSHNFAGSDSTIAIDYWILKNALDYTTPEVVVLDCSSLQSNDRISKTGKLHEQIDEFPLTMNKIRMINDLLGNRDDRIQFLWKFSMYHSRWNELTLHDFKKDDEIIDRLNRGATPQSAVAVPEGYEKLDKNDKLYENTLGIEYLCKIIEECQSRNIDILLTYLPFPADEPKQRESNRVYDIAKEYGVDYINFLDLNVVNYETDCFDEGSHLNPSGGRKITAYLGDYLVQNYGLSDHREDEAYMSWNNYFEKYMENKTWELTEQIYLDNYLMMLADKNLSCCIYISKDAKLLYDERLYGLLNNIPQYEAAGRISEAAGGRQDYFIVVDSGWPAVSESVGNEPLDISTTFGHVVFGADEENNPYLYIQDGEENYLEEQYEISIAVINKYTGSVEDVALFTTRDESAFGIRKERSYDL